MKKLSVKEVVSSCKFCNGSGKVWSSFVGNYVPCETENECGLTTPLPSKTRDSGKEFKWYEILIPKLDELHSQGRKVEMDYLIQEVNKLLAQAREELINELGRESGAYGGYAIDFMMDMRKKLLASAEGEK